MITQRWETRIYRNGRRSGPSREILLRWKSEIGRSKHCGREISCGEVSNRWRIRPFFGGAVHIYSNPSRQYTSEISPRLLYFHEGEGERRAHAPVSPTSCHPPCFRYFTLCYIHTGRRAADILAAGNPYKETHLRRDTSDFAGVACEGHAVRMSRRRGRQMLDRATPYSERNECRRTLAPLAASLSSFDCSRKVESEKLNAIEWKKRDKINIFLFQEEFFISYKIWK